VTAVRAVARAVLGAVLLLVFIGAMLWTWAGPQGWPLVAWLLAACVVITGAGLGMSALQPKGGGDG
jgi:NhaP-type Na+/H+ or K+/H+ antiporter